MNCILAHILVIIAAIHIIGCGHGFSAGNSFEGTNGVSPETADLDYGARIMDLQKRLTEMSPVVNAAESKLLAREAILYSLQLAREYKVVRPPLYHNSMVNYGFKPRGLCTHWTKDLLEHFKGLKLKSFHFYWGVANRNDPMRIEHSTVVAVAADQSFEDGMVLDPWRYSGFLYYNRVTEDDYQWEESKLFKPLRGQHLKTAGAAPR